MKEGKILMLSFLMCLVTGGGVYLLVTKQQKKTAVVDAVKLFDQFNMKKELEARAKIKLEMMSKQVDSVENLLRMAKATSNEEEIKKLAYAYSYVKAGLENEYKQSNQDINQKVWQRLNPFIEEYGKQKGMHLIIGANGMGSVLYDDSEYDLTDDLVKYINKKYEEGN